MRFTRRRKKYFSIPTGQFKSRLENTIWEKLPHKIRKIKFTYEPDKLPYVIERNYIPDVRVDLPSGKMFYIEIKGYFRPEDRAKMIAAKKMNPNLDIRIVFAADNLLRKGSTTRNSDWATRHGFLWSINEVPKEWFR